MGWFGRKKSAVKEPQSITLTLEGAVDLALRAQISGEWVVGSYEVHGQEGKCSVGARRSSLSHELGFALAMADRLEEYLGDSYEYGVTVYGTVVHQTLSSVLAPGWRTYAQPIDHTQNYFESLKEFRTWMDTPQSLSADVDAWWVSATKK